MDKEYYELPISSKNIIIDQLIYYPKFDVPTGYLHLLEHILVKQNRSLIDNFESNLDIFNAITDIDKMVFLFIHKNELFSPKLDFKIAIFEHTFQLEKEIILEERRLYSNERKDINQIIGSSKDIEKFNLNRLKRISNGKNFNLIHIRYNSKNRTNQDYDPIEIKGGFNIKWVTNSTFILKKDFNAELFSYYLYIFRIACNDFKYNIEQALNTLLVTVENREKFLNLIKCQNNILTIYKLSLKNLNFRINETIKIYDHFGLIFDIADSWEKFDWGNITDEEESSDSLPN